MSALLKQHCTSPWIPIEAQSRALTTFLFRPPPPPPRADVLVLLAVRILSVHYSPVRLVRAFVRGEIVSPLSTPRTAGAVAADTK